jgi:hypothetical protein
MIGEFWEENNSLIADSNVGSSWEKIDNALLLMGKKGNYPKKKED